MTEPEDTKRHIPQSRSTAGLGVGLTDDQKTTLWLGAFRYYCGRMTYAVGDFCETLIAVWPELPDRTRSLIQRDLTEEFQRDDEQRADDVAGTRYYKRLGHDVDRKQWEKVRALWETPNVEVTGATRPYRARSVSP